ncbi:MAG TPA: hypothetical protein VLW17_00005 [Thermoanaerobaculaceae bacterium]|nr:hypothetical protein [Thermoanaerobaculaceae bacterium]
MIEAWRAKTACLFGLLTVASIASAAIAAPAEAAIPVSERQVLIDLYDTANGVGWTQQTNWRNGTNTDFNGPGT